MSYMTAPQSSMTLSGSVTTPFGAVENTAVRDLAKMTPGSCRIDLLTSLQAIWGATITNKRDMLYRLLAGSLTDTELHSYLKYFYLRYPAFANYVDNAYYFGDTEISFIQRVIGPARERVESYYMDCTKVAREYILGVDSDYVYFKQEVALEGCEHVNA